MAEVWEFTFEKKEKEIGLNPIGTVDTKDLVSMVDPVWENPSKHKKLNGRIGGGLVLNLYAEKPSWLIIQKDELAPRMPLALDIPSGLGDLSLDDKAGDAKIPSIPILYELFAEMYEIVIQDEKGVFYTFIPKNIQEEFKPYLTSTSYQAIKMLNRQPIDLCEKDTAVIGEFKEGWTLAEYRGKDEEDIEIRGTQVAFDGNEKSLEVIIPVQISVKDMNGNYGVSDLCTKEVKLHANARPVFHDGEHFGEPNLHDVGLDVRNVTPLNRMIVELYGDGTLTVYRQGKIVQTNKGENLENIPIEEYLQLKNFKLKGESEYISMEDAIRRGITPGWTNKIETLYNQAKKGNPIIFNNTEMSLDAFGTLGDHILRVQKDKNS